MKFNLEQLYDVVVALRNEFSSESRSKAVVSLELRHENFEEGKIGSSLTLITERVKKFPAWHSYSTDEHLLHVAEIFSTEENRPPRMTTTITQELIPNKRS